MASVYARELKHGARWYASVKNTSGVTMKKAAPGKWISYDTEIPAPRRVKDESEDAWRKRINRDPSAADALTHARTIQAKLDRYGFTPTHERANPFDTTPPQAVTSTLQWRERYLEYCSQRRLAQNTVRRYRETLGKVPDLPMAEFDKSRLADFCSAITGESASTYNGRLADLRAFLNFVARESDYKPPRIELARQPDLPDIQTYSADQCNRLLDVADKYAIGKPGGRDGRHESFPFRLFLLTLMLGGFRLNEAGRLQFERPTDRRERVTWVDLDHSQFVVPGAVAKGRRTRYVPILPELQIELDNWPHRTGRLFPFSLSSGRVRDVWDKVKREAQVPDFPLKALRATCGRLLRERGVDVDTICYDILGHDDPKTTRRYYAALGSPSIQALLNRPEFTTPILQISRK